jgi:hypothetical protein
VQKYFEKTHYFHLQDKRYFSTKLHGITSQKKANIHNYHLRHNISSWDVLQVETRKTKLELGKINHYERKILVTSDATYVHTDWCSNRNSEISSGKSAETFTPRNIRISIARWYFLYHGHYLFQNCYKKKRERTIKYEVLECFLLWSKLQILVSTRFTISFNFTNIKFKGNEVKLHVSP